MLIASHDEMSLNLRKTVKNFMIEHFGCNVIRALSYRQTYVMIGQKGISYAKAIESVNVYKNKNKEHPVSFIKQCVSFPRELISKHVNWAFNF